MLRLALLFGVFVFSAVLILFLPTAAGSNAKSLFLGASADWFVDFDNRDDATVLAEQDKLFTPSDGKIVNRGVAGGVQAPLWLRVKIPVLQFEPGQTYTLSLEETRVRQITLFLEKNGTRRTYTYRIGVAQPITGYPARYFSQTLNAEDWSGATILIKVVTGSSKRAVLWLEPEEVSAHREARQSLFFGLLFGVQLAVFVYLLGVGLSLRDPALISLGVLAFVYFLQVAADRSFVETVLQPSNIELGRYLSFFGVFAAFAAWMTFQRAYLRVKEWSRHLATILKMTIFANIILSIFAIVDIYFDLAILRLYSSQIGLFNLLLSAIVALAALRYNTLRGLVFLLAWAPSITTIAARLTMDARPGAVEEVVPIHAVYIGVMIGLLTFSIVLSLDIRDREVGLRQLAEANAAKLRDYAAAASDGFFETDHDGTVIEMSGHAAEAFAESPGNPLLARAQHPANADSIRLVSQSISYSLPFRAVQLKVQGESGEQLFEISGTPVASGFRGIVSEVTERERIKAIRERETRFATIGQLAGNLAHDINNLLHPIINLSRRVRDRLKDDEAGRYYLDHVTKAGERASNVVAGFLATAHGAKDFRKKVPLSQAMREISTEILAIVGEHCQVVTHIDDSPAPLVQVSDAYQVLSNLVSNAVHASPPGSTVTITFGTSDGRLRLDVKDSGAGMDAATKQRLEEQNFTTKAPGQGTGLGLGIVREIAGRWNARLVLDSAPGAGTTATLFFDSPPPGENHGT